MNKKLLALALLTLTIGCAERANFAFECDDCVVEGAQGAPGEAGFDGHDALIEVLPLAVSCSAGGYSLLTATDSNSNGLIDSTDKNYSLVDVCNGLNGSNGANGNDGQNGTNGTNGILAIVDPCGDKAGVHDEVLIRLSDGRLLASFSNNVNGDYTRFSILQAGNGYMSTDGSNCFFSVDANNQLFNEHY